MNATNGVKKPLKTLQQTTELKTDWTPKPNDLVFAKLRGYSFWPAKVIENDCEMQKGALGKYTVFFFGTHDIGFVTAKDIVQYKENKDKYGKVKNKKFVIALKEIEETCHIAGNPSPVSSRTVEIENSNSNIIDTSLVITEASTDRINCVDGQSGKKRGPGRPRKIQTPALPHMTDATTGKKRAGKAESTKNSATAPIDSKTNITDATNAPHPNETRRDLRKRTTVDSDSVNDHKMVKKTTEKQLKPHPKVAKNRQERLKKLRSSLDLPVTLSILKSIEHEILESLSEEKTDSSRCLRALSRLDFFQITFESLSNYPKILNTIKLCRNHKSDEQVRQKSNYLYNKFKLLFAKGIDEA